ncbi:MAG TPA: hypothetical protein VHF26_20925 [Trebonia sp.]|jgi:hypothetical protein|nr:hypothetical protein [Trebonia sp.]
MEDPLDQLVADAYSRRPGEPPLPFDPATARRTLAVIAARLNEDGARDLNWWQIPAWVPPLPRIVGSAVTGALAAGFTAWVTCGLALAVTTGLQRGAAAGIAEFLPGATLYGILFGLAGGVAGVASGVLEVRSAARPGVTAAGDTPPVIGDVRLAKALTRDSLRTEFRGGLVAGIICGLTGGVVTGGLAAVAFGLLAGLAYALGALLLFGLWSALATAVLLGIRQALMADPGTASSLDPAASCRGNRQFGQLTGVVFGTLFGLTAGVLFGFVGGVQGALADGLAFGLATAVTSAVTAGIFSSRCFPVTLAAGWLALHWGTPVRLVRFLSDACDRNVLRAVDPSYQFRDAQLQDQFAAAAPIFRDRPAAGAQPPALKDSRSGSGKI